MAPLMFDGTPAAIPAGSLILVTGANGYIGSHVCDQLLEAGYRVRGTSRDSSKTEWLKALFDRKYAPGRFEATVVPDMAVENAFDEACKGVQGVCHVASVLTFSPDPNAVIPTVVAGARNAATSAAKNPSITRFVYTSSSVAITAPHPNKVFDIRTTDWNTADVEAAWAPPPYGPERAWPVYGASKTQAEQALWEFMEQAQPRFVLNSVLPNANFGELLNGNVPASTGDWCRQLYRGEGIETLASIPPQWMVNVKDTARLHVAALLDPDVQGGERILAFAQPYTMNEILAVLRKNFPGKSFVDDLEDGGARDLSRVDNSRGRELLRRLGRSEGFVGLEESVLENVRGL